MPDEDDAYADVERVARAALGPAARVMRAQIRVLAGALRPGERAEAFGSATSDRAECTVLVSSQRLLIAAHRGRSPLEMIVDAAWGEVAVLTSTPRRVLVLDTPGGRITLDKPFPELTFTALAAQATGAPIEGDDAAAPAGFPDVVRRSLGGRAALHDNVLARLARELAPDERLVAIGEHREPSGGLVAVTTHRVGLVPRAADRTADWIARSAVTRALVSERSELVITAGSAEVRYRIASPVQAGALAGGLAPPARSAAAPAGPATDLIKPRLAELADDLESWLGAAAAVERTPRRVTLLPAAPGAVAVGWSDVEGSLCLEVDRGRAGSLGIRRTDGGVTLVGEAVRAVVDGELDTVAGCGRLRTVLHLPRRDVPLDEVDTGLAALLPLPRWHAWWPGRRHVAYAPYRQA